MRIYSLLISLMLFASATVACSQNVFSSDSGQVKKYTTVIEMPKGYISGICVLSYRDDDQVYGCVFNEFGITAIDFVYNESKKRIRIKNVIAFLDKWYIRKTLKKDLKQVMIGLKNGHEKYYNSKRNIQYTFTPIMTDSITSNY